MHHRYFVLVPIVAALAVTTAALLRVKFGRRYRGHHVRRGYGRHGRPCGNDLVDRVLGALVRVDVWILVISFLTLTLTLTLIVGVAGVIFEYLTLVKPG